MKMNCFKSIQMSLKIQHCQGMNIKWQKSHELVNLPLIDSLKNVKNNEIIHFKERIRWIVQNVVSARHVIFNLIQRWKMPEWIYFMFVVHVDSNGQRKSIKNEKSTEFFNPLDHQTGLFSNLFRSFEIVSNRNYFSTSWIGLCDLFSSLFSTRRIATRFKNFTFFIFREKIIRSNGIGQN